MANTYTLLETITVGAAGASSVTFNSIPQTGYTDLVIKVSARSAFSGVSAGLGLQVNGLTSSIYTMRMIQGNGTNATSNGYTSITFISTDNGLSAATSTANTFNNAEIYIPNYLSSNHKSVSIDAVTENNATTAYGVLNAGLIATTAAISSVTLFSGGSANFAQHSTFSLYGVSALGVTPTKAPKATGGSIIQTDGTYWYHAFLSSGTFTPATALSCDVLVVAGGGAGAGAYGGGGGAGGVLAFASQSIGTSGQTVTVGGGGAGGGISPGGSGANSQFAALTVSVGGGGGGLNATSISGGSGGGGTGGISALAGGAGTSGQGNTGGAGFANGGAGGGGGAGAVGTSATTISGATGGTGTTSVTNWGALTAALTATGLGVSNYLAGGGGGGSYVSGNPSIAGGAGGGGTSASSTVAGTSGTANTGSGGGGGGYIDGTNYRAGGNGGSGVVIVRYLA